MKKGFTVAPTPDHEHLALLQKSFLANSEALKGFILSLVGPGEHVDDLLHATFLRVVQKGSDFQAGTNFLAWARTVARYVVLQSLRNNARSPQTFPPELIEKLADEAPTFDMSDARLIALNDCLERLSPRSRKAIELQYGHAMKPAAIAEQLAATPEAIYVMLSRARAFLAQCVQRVMWQYQEP
jgi:RNA polymerase sigma-70 factor (ECF subfamily)